MRCVTGFIAILAALACALPEGAGAGGGLQTLRFERLGADRLGFDAVGTAAVQDDRGVMWLGTRAGLLRFDGHEARLLEGDRAKPSPALNARVLSLLSLSGGRVLMGTDVGLSEVDTRTETVREMALPGAAAAGAPTPVLRIVGAGGDKVWVLTMSALLQLDTASGAARRIELPGLQPQPTGATVPVGDIAADGTGGLWFASGRVVVHVGAQGEVLAQGPDPGLRGAPLRPRALLLDRDVRLWIADDRGVRALDTRTGQLLDLPRTLGLPTATAHALMQDSEGTLWVGFGPDGVWRWPAGARAAEAFVHHPALRESLMSNTVSLLFEDRSGVLWVGHWSGGFSLADIRSQGFRNYRAIFGEAGTLSSDDVAAIAPDGATHAWIATYGHGLNRLDLANGAAQRVPLDGAAMPYQKALLLQPQALWIGGDDGLLRMALPRRQVTRIDLGPHGTGRVVSALAEDGAGGVWAATFAGVVHVSAQGAVQRYTDRAGGKRDVVDSLLRDRDGRLWLGTKAGVRRYDPQRDTFVEPGAQPGAQPAVDAPATALLGQLSVAAMRQDARGSLWLATQRGLHELRPSAGQPGVWTLHAWRDLPGAPKDAVTNLELAADDAVWVSTDEGLTRLDPDRRAMHAHLARRGQFPGGFMQGASARSADGMLFFGGTGVTAFLPQALRSNAAAPGLVLGDIRLFNRSLQARAPHGADRQDGEALAQTPQALGITGPVSSATAVTLRHQDSMVSFEIRPQHFQSAGLARVAWQLKGWDDHWIYGRRGEGVATYTNLGAGRYELWAKASNPDDVWGEPVRLLSVDVQPPWWQAAWFRTLAALGLALAVVAFWRWRVHRLVRVQQQLEAEVARRTQQVRAQREQIGEAYRQLSVVSAELTRRNAELEERSSSRIRLLAAASHDLRQPVHALGILAELGPDALKDPDRAGGWLLSMSRCTSTLSDMLGELMDLGRLDGGHFVPALSDMHLPELMHDIMVQFGNVARRKNLTLHAPPVDLHVLTDRHLLRRIVFNLVSNAVKYTVHGGVTVRVERKGDEVVLWVTDTGPGIPKDRLQDVFRDYVRLDPTHVAEGLGIGLSTVRRAADLLGHPLQLESEPGRGTSVSLRMPMSVGAPVSAAQAPDGPTTLVAGQLIAVLEDDDEVRTAMSALLVHWGHEVIAAADIDSLSLRLRAQAQRPALLVTDLHLQQGNGIEAARRVREELGLVLLPTLLVTGDLDTVVAAEAAQAAQARFLTAHKPITPQRLKALLAQLLQDEDARA